MGTLFIDRKDVELRQPGKRLEIYEADRHSGTIPIPHLERVVIHSRTRLDTGVLSALAEQGVGLVVLNRRKSGRVAILMGRSHNDAGRRVAQYHSFLNSEWRTRWSTMLVSHKIRAQHRMLSRALIQRPDLRHTLLTAIRALEERLTGLKGAPSRERSRGLEGAASAAYFKGFISMFPDSLDFTGRNRRPPRDPVNACLSLGYTLLHSDAVMACHGAGLDPLLGFYHDPAYGRESLASDLIEPLRPKVDEWVWSLFRERTLRAENFSRKNAACLLDKTGRDHFYRAWEVRAGQLRRFLRRYSQILARDLVRRGDGLMMTAPEDIGK